MIGILLLLLNIGFVGCYLLAWVMPQSLKKKFVSMEIDISETADPSDDAELSEEDLLKELMEEGS